MNEVETHGDRVKASILATGLDLWRGKGVAAASARQIGKTIGLTHAAVLYHFGSAEAMKAAIALEAVRIADPVIVPQLITMKHPAADALSSADRRRFLADC